MIIFSVGISGCGKSAYGEKLKNKIGNLEIVCPDDIRKEILGDVNKNNYNVFKIANERIIEAIKNNKVVYYSATNLTKKNRKNILEIAKEYDQEVVAVVFLTCWRPDICEARVSKDLSKGIDRSNTLVKDDNGDTIIRRQFKQWASFATNINEFSKELKENSKKSYIHYLECEPE